MSNSPLVSYTQISPNRTTLYGAVKDTITIHCVVGQCTVETLGAIFAPSSRRASSNYGVGKDGRIGMYVEEKDRSWCTSSTSNDNRAITIEVASDTFYPYAINDKAMEGLIGLLVDICKRNPEIGRLKWKGDKALIGQVSAQNMTAHRWFAATECPGDYLYQRLGSIAQEVNRRLEGEQEDDMDVKRFTELYEEMTKEWKDNDAGEYSEDARNWAVENGLIEGSGVGEDGKENYMWELPLTREQLVTVLYRFDRLESGE